MRPLRILWVVKNSPTCFENEHRNMGYASYPVPEFTWEKRTWGNKGSVRDLAAIRDEGFDLVLHEDGGSWCTYTNRGALPVVYLSIDDTLSDGHLLARQAQSEQATLTLVDHGPLDHFTGHARKLLRFTYCVNDRIFYPMGEKTTDVVFHCSAGQRQGEPGAVERIRIRQLLHEICERRGWSYRSGVRGLWKYARSLAQARVVVNAPRTATNRPHRIFDVMAVGSCLLTKPIPIIPSDGIHSELHYETFLDDADLEDQLELLLEHRDDREQVAAAGHFHVMDQHTWALRATQLREILHAELRL